MTSGKRAEQTPLLEVQKALQDALQDEVERLFGEPDPAIVRYENEARRELSPLYARARAATKRDLLDELASSDLVFVADYHTLDQAQRTALRILRSLDGRSLDGLATFEAPGRTPWTLALEMIPSRNQKDLDAYLSGQLPLEEFHRRVRYAETWGFPWENYAPLFEWARAVGARVIGLNASGAQQGAAGLVERDHWAAKVLVKECRRQLASGIARPRILVLYGELHVSAAHLPQRAKEAWSQAGLKPPIVAVLHQNLDELFWILARKKMTAKSGLPPSLLRLRKREYCIFSSPPWSKLESLLAWAELQPIAYDGETDEPDDEPLTEADLDPLAQIRSFHRNLSDFFGLTTRLLEDVTLLPKDLSRADWARLVRPKKERPRKLSEVELKLIRALHAQERRFFVPSIGLLNLGDGDRNSAAELAAQLLLFERQKFDRFYRATSADFERRILVNAFAFLGSLILNPRRKCDFPEDHRRWIEARRGKILTRADRIELRARRYLLRAVEARAANRRAPSPPGGPLSNSRSAQRLGQLLGFLLFRRWMSGEVAAKQVQKIFFGRWSIHPRAQAQALQTLYAAVGAIPRRSARSEEL